MKSVCQLVPKKVEWLDLKMAGLMVVSMVAPLESHLVVQTVVSSVVLMADRLVGSKVVHLAALMVQLLVAQ